MPGAATFAFVSSTINAIRRDRAKEMPEQQDNDSRLWNAYEWIGCVLLALIAFLVPLTVAPPSIFPGFNPDRSWVMEAKIIVLQALAGGAPDPKAAELMRELRELRRKVEENAEYVGDRFAEEARKIHYEETEKRSIYGEASEDDAKALAEEGVEFARIPWVPRTNS